MTDTKRALAQYRDDNIAAEIHRNEDCYGLITPDWTEEFPTYDLAHRRLIELAQLGEGEGFEKGHSRFLADEIGLIRTYEFRWREYINEMARYGYETRGANTGGGIILAETLPLEGRLTVWADEEEGPRAGFYPTRSIEDGSPFFMLYPQGGGSKRLDRVFARQVCDAIEVIESLARQAGGVVDNIRVEEIL